MYKFGLVFEVSKMAAETVAKIIADFYGDGMQNHILFYSVNMEDGRKWRVSQKYGHVEVTSPIMAKNEAEGVGEILDLLTKRGAFLGRYEFRQNKPFTMEQVGL